MSLSCNPLFTPFSPPFFLISQFNVPDSEHTLGDAKNAFMAYGALHV